MENKWKKLNGIDLAVPEQNKASAHKFGINESMARRSEWQYEELSKCKKMTKMSEVNNAGDPNLKTFLKTG